MCLPILLFGTSTSPSGGIHSIPLCLGPPGSISISRLNLRDRSFYGVEVLLQEPARDIFLTALLSRGSHSTVEALIPRRLGISLNRV